jgi:aerobic carbon-monoxide dehydrogenase medium subunit
LHTAPFEFQAASSVEEAVGLLELHGDEAKVLAGGQSLIPMMNLRYIYPGVLVDVNGLEGAGPREEDGQIVISAFTRQLAVERDAVVRRGCPILVDALRHVGNVRVRARGTLGGNLAHGDPSSEVSCAALASGARLSVAGPSGTRFLPLEDLFVAYLTTSLAPSELITELRIPAMDENTGWAFLEMARRAGEFAIVNVACLVSVGPSDGLCTRVTLVLGGVDETPRDASARAAEVLVGQEPDARGMDEAAKLAADACHPRSDVHASAEYRRKVVRVYARRALELATERAVGERP